MKTREQMKLLFEGWNRFINEQEDESTEDPTKEPEFEKFKSYKKSFRIDPENKQQIKEFKVAINKYIVPYFRFSVNASDAIAAGSSDLPVKQSLKKEYVKNVLNSKDIDFDIPIKNIIVTNNVAKSKTGVSSGMEKGSSTKQKGAEEIFALRPDAKSFEVYDNDRNGLTKTVDGVSLGAKKSSKEYQEAEQALSSGNIKAKRDAKAAMDKAFEDLDLEFNTFLVSNGTPQEVDSETMLRGKDASRGTTYNADSEWKKFRNIMLARFITNTGVNNKPIVDKVRSVLSKFPLIANALEAVSDTSNNPAARFKFTLDEPTGKKNQLGYDIYTPKNFEGVTGTDLDLRREEVRSDINKLMAAIRATKKEISAAREELKRQIPSIKFPEAQSGEAGEASSESSEKQKIRIFDFDGTLFNTGNVLGVPDPEFFLGYMRPNAIKAVRSKMLEDPKPINSMIEIFKSGDPKNTFILTMIKSSGFDKPLAEFIAYLKTEDVFFRRFLINGIGMSESDYGKLVSSIPDNFEQILPMLGHSSPRRVGSSRADFGSRGGDEKTDSDEIPDDASMGRDQELENPLGDEEGGDYEDRDWETDDFHYESKQLNKKVLKEGVSTFRLVMVKRK